MPAIRQPTDVRQEPNRPSAAVSRIAYLLFKAWITPQRICGCKRPRDR